MRHVTRGPWVLDLWRGADGGPVPTVHATKESRWGSGATPTTQDRGVRPVGCCISRRHHRGRNCGTPPHVADATFRPLTAPRTASRGSAAIAVSITPLQALSMGEWNARMRIETVFSLRMQVCGLKKRRKRKESSFRDRQSLCRDRLQPLGGVPSRLPASPLPRSHAASQVLLQYRRVLQHPRDEIVRRSSLCR